MLVFSAESEEGVEVRKMLTPHLKDIRVCSLSLQEICCQVMPKKVLTNDELKLVCVAIESREATQELTEICAELEPRNLVKTPPITQIKYISKNLKKAWDSEFILTTYDKYIEPMGLYFTDRFNMSVKGRIIIRKQTIDETMNIVRFDAKVTTRGSQFKVCVSSEEKSVLLLPNTTYIISVNFGRNIDKHPISSRPGLNKDFYLHFPRDESHFQELSYRVHTDG